MGSSQSYGNRSGSRDRRSTANRITNPETIIVIVVIINVIGVAFYLYKKRVLSYWNLNFVELRLPNSNDEKRQIRTASYVRWFSATKF